MNRTCIFEDNGLASLSYDDLTRVLTVLWVHGKVEVYKDIDRAVFGAICAASNPVEIYQTALMAKM